MRCQIRNFRSMSSHADKDELFNWVDGLKKKPECIFIVHGEEETCKTFALRLIEQDYNAIVPKYSSLYDLHTYEPIFEGHDLRRGDIERTEQRESPVFQRLMLAGMRLVEVISRNKGGTNKDLAKFADQIDSLSNKWDR